MWKCAFVIIAVSLVARADAPKSDLKRLEGTWQLISGENQGKQISEERVKAITLVIKGDKYTLQRGENSSEGTLKLDPKMKPKTIDSTTSNGDTLLGVYELKGDEFKVCLALPGKDRPKDFKSGDLLQSWKRKKKK
jgi:uncharacterized protein (TIGR03067 family)